MPDQPMRDPGPQRLFAVYLRELRMEYGKPTEQELARRMSCGRTTVSDLLNGRRFPTWEQVLALVRACAVEDASKLEPAWRDRWLAASRALDSTRHGQMEQTPPHETWSQAADGRPGADSPLPPSMTHTPTTLVEVTWYQDNPAFYRSGAEHVRRAKAEIRVTYVRRYPPTAFTTPASVEYFTAVLDWARKRDESQRSVRRIIGLPHIGGAPDPAMFDWVRQHREETADILNYEATILPWYSSGDGLNMALIDDDTAFLAFSGGSRQKLNGFSIDNSTLVAYFTKHFDQLWSTLESLEGYLSRIDRA